VYGVGSNGICHIDAIGHVAYYSKGPQTERIVPRFPLGSSGIDPGDLMQRYHLVLGFFTIALSRSADP
jgi:hypothetical protein